MKPPLVLFSEQAPNLLTRFADTEAWRLRVTNPTVSQLAELRWNGLETPHACVVHEHDAFLAYRERFPKARMVWLFHSGRIGFQHNGLRPVEYDAHEILVCSNRLRRHWQAHYPAAKIHVVAPWYRPRSTWSWVPNVIFSMLNDPKTRWPDRERLTRETMAASGLPWTLYGAGQRLGPLSGSMRTELEHRSTAYVDVLPTWAGFGLAHHELMAAGVPVVSSVWGDLDWDTDRDLEYISGLRPDLEGRVFALKEINANREFAECTSDAQLEYIAGRRTKFNMQRGIKQFLEHKP